jgi:folate-dependent phosphoribosylglycinamide formyltransferase PurN
VDEVYDRGPIVLQRSCAVLPDDRPETLAARVFDEECRAYPEAIRRFLTVRRRGAGVTEVQPAETTA